MIRKAGFAFCATLQKGQKILTNRIDLSVEIERFLMSVRYEEDPLKEEIRSSVPCNDKNKNNNNRYEYLLQQVSQLNGDLHKTVAISTSLKEENEYLREKHSQVY